MAYETPEVGTILPAKENANPKIENPGPVHQSDGLNEWLQAQAAITRETIGEVPDPDTVDQMD